jgi:hypothetical protein
MHHEAMHFENTPNSKFFDLAVKFLTENEKVWGNGVGAARYQITGVKYLCVLNCVIETTLTSLRN